MKNKPKCVLLILFILIALLSLYLAFFPLQYEPIGWDAPKFTGYEGPYKTNKKLENLNYIDLGPYNEPEHIVYYEGWLYASMENGAIIRVKPDGTNLEEVVNTKGRPFGFDFDATGALIVTDPLFGKHGGLLKVTNIEKQPKIELLTDSVDGTPFGFPDGVVVAKNGKIYFTDATQKVDIKSVGGPVQAAVVDVIANTTSGRVLEYNPETKKTRVVMHSLSFANGIALSEDESSLFVSELGKYRIWKINVNGDNISASQETKYARVLVDNLPGTPDNIYKGEEGHYWIGFPSSRNEILDAISDKPNLRAVFLRLLNILPNGIAEGKYAHVIAIDENGKVLADLQDPGSQYLQITGVTEAHNKLFFHNINDTHSIGWLNKNEVILE